MSKLVTPTVDARTTEETTTEPDIEADTTTEFAGRSVDPVPAGPPIMFDAYCSKRLPNTIDRWNKVLIRMRRTDPRSASD